MSSTKSKTRKWRIYAAVHALAAAFFLSACAVQMDIADAGANNTVASGAKSDSAVVIPADEIYKPGAVIIRGDKDAIQAWFDNNKYKADIDVIEASVSLYIAHYEGAEDPEALSETLNRVPGIEFAEPNHVVRLDTRIPNMPHRTTLLTLSSKYALMQWALNNVGQDSPSGLAGTPGADIHVLNAWEETTGSEEVVIGIIDSGIDYTHPDIRDNIWVNQKELDGEPGVDDDGNGYVDDIHGWNFIARRQEERYHGSLGSPNVMDDNNHGTHCAGIAGASGTVHLGVSGVSKNVRLMALKFLDKNGGGYIDEAVRAVFYGIQNGAHILSNSWGGGAYSAAMNVAIEAANDANVMFVAAAGNGRSNTDYRPVYPAGYQHNNVVSVAATDNRDRMATFSNYGAKSVHIAAPGVDIFSTVAISGHSDPTEAYETFSGTSMAAPMVSGAAALLLAYQPDLRNDVDRLKKLLMASVDRISNMEGRIASGGRLNIERAFELSQDLSANIDGTSLDISKYELVSEDINQVIRLGRSEKIDDMWHFIMPGAKYVRLVFESIMIDAPGFDLLAFYNKHYQHIFSYETQVVRQEATPWISGPGIRMRFANAFVTTGNWFEPGSQFYNHTSEEIRVARVEYLVDKEESK